MRPGESICKAAYKYHQIFNKDEEKMEEKYLLVLT